ncbi:MAG: right-handed parallel beta-helix repeat-containing protein, partial [Clostridia bacterium]|nr:right-handed parallel beta-helix repeat-containing protein [Clostridia bacterium]
MRLYVGTEGNYDGETFATPEEAVTRMRSLRASGVTEKVEIYLEGGTYYSPGTLVLDDRDYNYSIQPVGDDEVTITASSDIPLSEFTLVSGDSKLLPAAQGNVYKVKLSNHGISGYNELPVVGHSRSVLEMNGYSLGGEVMPIICQDDNLMTLARYPNDGYLTTQSVVTNGTPENGNNFAFKVDSDRLTNWANESNAWMHGFWYYDWSDQTAPISSIDTSSKTIAAGLPSAYGVRSGQRFYVYNMLCELDEPGEWYYDGEYLYIWPTNTNADSKVSIGFNQGARTLTLSNTHDASISGLRFINAPNYLLRIENNCEDITVSDCLLKNSGFGAVSVHGSNITVSECEISHSAKGAIVLNGGDNTTLTPGNNAIIGSKLHDYGWMMKCYSAGASVGGVGNKILNCEIYNSPQNAITGSGNDHLIQGNKIHDVLKEAADAGAIYFGRSYVQRGNKFIGNGIYNLASDSSHGGQYGIYLDDCFSGATITGNTFRNITGSGVFVNGGRDTTVTNNTFSNVSGTGIILANTGLTDWNGATDDEFFKTMGLKLGLHTTAPYAKYAHLANVLNDEP